jgi:hypothetical protein
MNPKLAASEWVRSFRKPITYGPANPPSCETEVMSPKVAAAADSVRIMGLKRRPCSAFSVAALNLAQRVSG